MSFETRVWREVARHLELEEAVRRIAPILGEVLPVDAVLVRRVDKEPLRLTTVAAAPCRPEHPVEMRAVRSALEPESMSAFAAFARSKQAVLVSSRDRSPLFWPLAPSGFSGSAIAGPLLVESEPVAVLVLLASGDGERELGRQHVALAERVLDPFAVAFQNDRRLHELARTREALEADRRALLSRLDRQDIRETIVGASAGLSHVLERCEQVARTDVPVLILGETGSGKEVIARTIHEKSARAHGPVVRVNCGAIAPELIDSELFGHERGAFTGAVAMRKGWFERADGGTLFLDEIGELPLAAQVRLLRVLQDGSLERVGGQGAISVDVRIVAATHRNLETMVAEGAFREDLWYRISVFPIRLPPLRERAQDIPALAAHFASRAGQRLGAGPLTPTEHDIELLLRYSWPGNVRELIAVIERAAILGDGKRLEVAKALGVLEPGKSSGPTSRMPASPAPPPPKAVPEPAVKPVEPLERAMRDHIEQALAATHGRIEGRFGAAKLLGVNPHTLRARMRKLGIDWARYRKDDESGAKS